jgi:hypothetical protein
MSLAGIKDQAFGKEFVEEVIKQTYRFAAFVYVPYQELVVQSRD